jgi:hypothetical protein
LQRKVRTGGVMRDLEKALADIGSIRQQLAAGTVFRGFGPAVIALTGVLALVTASAQAIWLGDPTDAPLGFLSGWAVAAVAAAALIWAEMLTRSRRHHSGLADAMILNAIEQFLPAGAAGVAIALVLFEFAPETLWVLPGLWQILVSLGLFAALRSLPRAVVLAAAFYFVAGVGVLIVSSRTQALSPWLMGVPFAAGQFLLAAVLHIAFASSDGETASGRRDG